MGRAFVRTVIACFILIGLYGPAEARRVALVIGNSAYEHASPLANPKNDANALAAALERLDFEVVKGIDLKQLEFEKTVRNFARTVRGADVALLFYAGHGLQVGGRNYLAPVDAKLSDEADLDFETLPLTTILKQMEREVKTNLVFLDACRDNPLARNLARSMGTRSASVGRGLARVDSGIGTLIAFATEPGNVALDGSGGNSPFTQALLKHIETPGLDIAQMMRRVRSDVMRSTAQRQVPWNNSSLTGDFYFAGKVTVTAGNPPQDDKRFSELQDELKKLKEQLKNKPAPQQKAKDDQKLAALQKELAELREELKKRPMARPEPRDDKKMQAMQEELAKLREELTKRPVVQPEHRDDRKMEAMQEELAALRQQLEEKAATNESKRPVRNEDQDAERLFSNGWNAYDAKNFARAAELWRKGAELGSPHAMYSLAHMLSNGKGARRDLREAAYWIVKSFKSAAGDEKVFKEVSSHYLKEAPGLYRELNKEVQKQLRAEGTYTGPIDGRIGPGTRRAIEALAKSTPQQNKKSAAPRPDTHSTNRSADADYAEAGKLELYGELDKALRLFESAANKGHQEAAWRIAWIHLTPGTHQNCKIAVQWLEKGVRQGNQKAMYKLGDLYRRGSCVAQNLAKADELAARAAKQ